MLYLDNAATGGRKPDAVVSAVTSAAKLCANPGRSGHKLSLACAASVLECRKALSVNGQPQEKADLNFLVYHSHDDTYFRPAAWYGLCALTALGGCILVLSFLLTYLKSRRPGQ